MQTNVGKPDRGGGLKVAGLFAGIGGIELGLHAAGHTTELLCEIDPGASRVLRTHFPSLPLVGDVRTMKALPRVDLVAAGFPCQDLSQAGKTAGIKGQHSGLVGEVFRLLRNRKNSPRWLLLENVPFMLQLDRGKAMRFLVDSLEELGFTWAYRVVDSRSFGLPQRRNRVVLLASRTEDPREILLASDAGERQIVFDAKRWCGFYWTEGLRGLGWAVDAVPTLKGGSSVGIASPPAIWNPVDGSIVTPELRDAERLQGFEADWTLPALAGGDVRKGHRWKLVGNAVCVALSTWVGERLNDPQPYADRGDRLVARGVSWPKCAWGRKGKVYAADLSAWPVRQRAQHLAQFLRYPTTPLSARATAGFYSRAQVSGLYFEPGFLEDVQRHWHRMTQEATVA